MSEVVQRIEIDAPVEEVWRLVMDPDRLGEWVTIHRGLLSHTVDGGPRRGDRMDQKLALRGAPFKVKWELVTCQAPNRAEWHGVGPARSHAETEYRLSDNGRGGTCFDYRNEFKAPMGPLGAAASKALVGGLPEKEAVASLKALKALAEAKHAP